MSPRHEYMRAAPPAGDRANRRSRIQPDHIIQECRHLMMETRLLRYPLSLASPGFVPGQGQDDWRCFKQPAERKRGVKETCLAFLLSVPEQDAQHGSACT